jgi:hypothetical protein
MFGVIKHFNSFRMEYYERRKKSDKAKDKAGSYSSKHVRLTEALQAKRAAAAKK